MNEHLIMTDVEGRKRLRVLETVEIDHSLPKHRDKATGYISTAQGNFVTVAFSGSSTANFVVNANQSSQSRPSLLSRFLGLFKRAQVATLQFYRDKTALPVTTLFESLMGAGKRLENLKGRLADYQQSITYARQMGQTALVDQLEARLPIIETESVVISAGFDQYIEEATLIDFATKCEKGLRLDYIRHFTRLIPHAAQVRKVKLDELRAFDNYVILHFDPANKATALTKQEVEKKKDPILFGVLRGSPRLYHVYSWKDEHCTLTFADLIAKYGKDVLTLP